MRAIEICGPKPRQCRGIAGKHAFSSIGQIEENALFYLRSRGIDEVSARRFLLRAFAGECVDRMKPGAAREHAENLIHDHILAVANHLPAKPKTKGKQTKRRMEEVK